MLPEFYEWIGRIALRYSHLRKEMLHPSIRNNIENFRYEQVHNFVDKLIERFKDKIMEGTGSCAKNKKNRKNR